MTAKEGNGAAVARLRCGCGAALLSPTRAPEAIRFGERDLGVHVLSCPSCGEERRVYFEVMD